MAIKTLLERVIDLEYEVEQLKARKKPSKKDTPVGDDFKVKGNWKRGKKK